MRRINLRRLLSYFISGCLAAVLLVNALAESQDPAKKKAIPLGPRPRPDAVLSPDEIRTRIFHSNEIFVALALANLVPLDWCREFGSNCGKPAADAFCHDKGYRTATKFEEATDIGHTATFTEHQVCNSPICDGFQMIECEGIATIFESPRITIALGWWDRLDWCRDWEANCGKAAADVFCQRYQHFPRGALRFEIDRHVAQRTVTINGMQVCDGTKRNCDSFKVIECLR